MVKVFYDTFDDTVFFLYLLTIELYYHTINKCIHLELRSIKNIGGVARNDTAMMKYVFQTDCIVT